MVKEGNIQGSLWNVYDRLRTKMKNYEVVLYLLILHKEDLLGCLYEFHPELGPDETLLGIISKYQEKKRDVLKRGFDEFKREIHSMDLKDLKFIESTFNEMLSDTEFQALFETILFTLIKNRDYEKGEHILPDEISELIVELADIKADDHVYNPFAGLASFGIKLEENAYYLGEEINTTAHTLSQLRLFAHDKLSSSELKNCDSIISELDKATFDRIIASVPFGLRLPKNRFNDLKVRTAEEFFIKKAIDAVDDHGKIVAHVSNGFLSRGGREKNLRKELLNSGLIEGVIQLPSNLMYNTAISSSIIILSKGHTIEDPIKIIDASELYKQVSRTVRSLDYDAIISSFKEGLESDVFRLVKPEELKKDDYNLTVSRYFISQITSQFDGTKLKEILKSANKAKNIEIERSKIVSISDLNDHETGVYLDTENIMEREVKQPCFTLSDQSLLIARVGAGLKPTIFKSPSRSFLISKNIEAFSFDENQVDPGYLVFELRKDYVKKQIDKLQGGSHYFRLNRSDFLNIEIELPSIEKQRASLLETINQKSEEQLQKYSEGLTDLRVDFYRQFQSTRHTVRQYLVNVTTGLSFFKEFLKLKDGKTLNIDEIVSKNANLSLIEQVESMLNSTKEASKKLDLLEVPFVAGAKKTLNLLELTARAIDRFKRDEFQFLPVFDDDSFEVKNVQIEPLIQFNEDDFYTIFHNTIENFVEHGFKGRSNNLVLIVIEFDQERGKVLFDISNNGHPFKNGFSSERLKIRGESTKRNLENGISGNGGADIHELVKMNGAKFDVDLDENREFPVTYTFEFPLYQEELS